MAMTTRLGQAVGEVATAVAGATLEEAQSAAIEEKVGELGLVAQDAAPEWLYDLFLRVRDRRPTEGWIDFTQASSGEVMNFIEELDELLPVEFQNQEEQWVLAFTPHQMKATISVESKCYLVEKISEDD